LSFCTTLNIGNSYDLSIGQTYVSGVHSKTVPKVHDVKIWKRIVEAFADIKVAGTPTAIARELGMKQPSVWQWEAGETTPSRANILAIARRTGFLAGYIEDGKLPKKPPNDTLADDPLLNELFDIWAQLSPANRGRLAERATELLSKQFPAADDSSELHRRRG
jgi:transcriptional regulator with XRE-family HTH domain